MDERTPAFATRAVHAGQTGPPVNAPASAPIYQAAGWVFRDLDEVDAIYEDQVVGTVYGTHGAPNQRALEKLVASLEGAQDAFVAAGGMAAVLAILFAMLGRGDRVVASRDLYGNTLRLLNDFNRFGVTAQFVTTGDLGAVRTVLSAGARLLLAETISNPRMRVADIPALAELAHAHGALLVIDNTFASPHHCRPLALGADLVIESATKFLAGHHDVVLGAVAGARTHLDPIRATAVRASLTARPLDAWLTERSIATLLPRLEHASRSALEIARWLREQDGVGAVHYPGLTDHPDHAVAARLLENGFGAMLSFEIEGGREAVNRLLGALRTIRLVLSLGGVATTLSHPATSSHRALSPQARAALGIHDGFLRLSVGVEDLQDIIADLGGGLRAARA